MLLDFHLWTIILEARERWGCKGQGDSRETRWLIQPEKVPSGLASGGGTGDG